MHKVVTYSENSVRFRMGLNTATDNGEHRFPCFLLFGDGEIRVDTPFCCNIAQGDLRTDWPKIGYGESLIVVVERLQIYLTVRIYL